jgi:ParB family chromosome partitioning protein
LEKWKNNIGAQPMSKDKSSLGTGLDSLLGERPKADSQGVSKIAIEDLSPGQYQPRKKMYKSTLEELAQSIKEQGILQPLVVRRQASGRYEIVVGERRWRAAQLAGLESVPVLVRDLNNDETAKIALIENLQREDLNALDQARGLQRLQREFNLSQDALGKAVGKSRSTVTNLLRLLNLVPEVQVLLEEGRIEMGHARALLSVDPTKQLGFAQEVVKKSLSVRQTEALTTGNKQNKKNKKGAQSKDPNTKKLETDLSEILGATVSIKHNKVGRGSLTINFKNLDTLQGILEKIKK